MVDELCAPFSLCDDLDGRLLINQAIQGPPLAFELGEVSFGSFTTAGAAARPYVDLSVKQTWTPREACYGPVRSVFSLAPGESVQLVVSVDQQTSLVETVADHLPDVRSLRLSPTFSGIRGIVAGAGSKETREPVAELQQKYDKAQQLIRNTRYVNGYGSIFEDVVDPFGFFHEGGVIPHPPSPGEVVGAFTDLIKGTLGGPETPAAGAVGEAGAAASAAGDASVAHHTRDTTTTRSTSTETPQTLTRTVSNPYRDRSLQLRFIPVFRRFEVTTEATPPEVGVAVQTGMVGMAGQPVGQVLAEAVGAASRAEMQRPIARMFQNLNLEGGRVPALSWSQAHPREDSILVPIHDVGSFASSLGMGGDLREQLESSFTGIADLVAGLGRDGRRVDLFMGTHVEPVAGGCVLGDLPALEPDDS